jgi:DNA modification methylase
MTLTDLSHVETVRLYQGDCRSVMAELPDNSVDAVVTDPPYELGFMGKTWDSSGIAFDPEVWAQALRVLKPGGHLLAFGGTRKWHRLAVAIEDAGFEIRDNMAWLYGNGFPKSLSVSKAIDKAAGAKRPVIGTRTTGIGTGRGGTAIMGDSDNRDLTAPATADAKRWHGWGTALKPAFEPIVVARKPLIGTVAANVLEHGTGALDIDACRIPTTEVRVQGSQASTGATGFGGKREGGKVYSTGRWPANVILDEAAAAEVDRQSGKTKSTRSVRKRGGGSTVYGTLPSGDCPPTGADDEGGASRFFYVAKAPTKERPSYTKDDGTVVTHLTVKPLSLMRQLVRLVTPPGGLVLDPFAGSGATIEAAILEGFGVRGIELEADHIPLIQQRIDRALGNTAA